MLLAVDIGNSNIVMGLWNGRNWAHQWRIETHPIQPKNQYMQEFHRFFDEKNISPSSVSNIVVSSVVPKATPPILKALSEFFQPEPFILNATDHTGIAIETEHPEKVGTDLIADAAGAYELIKDTCLVVDFGTATTVMAVEKPGILRGVAICTGLKAAKEALTTNAAQLFDIPLQPPPSVLGRNTIEAMQAGLILGHICMVEGLIERMKQEIGPAKVVATGGFAEMLAKHTSTFDSVEPLLTLDGLRIIFERQ